MLDIYDILKILPHRYPFLLVDRILEIETNKRIVGIKNVTINEPFFQGHFPGKPVMPGVLIIEAMAQVGGLWVYLSGGTEPKDGKSHYPSKIVYLTGIDKARFRKQVIPGDQLVMELVTLKIHRNYWLVQGITTVNEELVAKALLSSYVVQNKLDPESNNSKSF